MRRHIASLLVMGGLAMALSGCLAPPLQNATAPQPGQSIVYGKVEVVTSGVRKEWECQEAQRAFCDESFQVTTIPGGIGDARTYTIAGDGSFYWALPPADYTLVGWQWHLAPNGIRSQSGTIGARFTVAPGESAVYVGTVAIRMAGGRYGVGLADEHDAATAQLRQKFPTLAAPAIRLAALYEELGQWKHRVPICDPHWGIACTDDLRGVIPVTPDSRSLDFIPVGSLHPLLAWQPAGPPGTHYDLILREVVSWVEGDHMRYMAGAIVDYASDLGEPRYTVKAALAPKSRYFWSVRLREGDTVSEWSSITDKHFLFLLVYASSSRTNGLPFAFSTP